MTDNSRKSSAAKPPYVPFSTFKNFAEGFRESGLPHAIDKSLMQSYSGTVQSILASALKSMGFVASDNRPTQRFETYLSSEVSQQRQALLEGLKDCYAVIFAHEASLPRMTQAQFDNALRDEFEFTASTLDKAASFFLAAASEANLEIGTHLKKRKATATRKRRADRSPSQGGQGQNHVQPSPADQSAPQEVSASAGKPLQYQLVDLISEPDFAEEHKAAAWQLIQYLMERQKEKREG